MASILATHLEKLEYLLRVHQAGSLSGAAKQLHLTQSAVSHAIISLEEALGAKLLHRLPRGVKVTRAGEQLVNYTKKILNELHDVEMAILNPDIQHTGQLRLGTHATIAIHILPYLVKEFHLRHPNIQLSITNGRIDTLMEGLLDKQFDGVVSVEPFKQSEYKSEVLFSGQLSFFAPTKPLTHVAFLSKKTISVEEANAAPILADMGAHVRQGLPLPHALADFGLGLNNLYELDSSEAALRLAAEGAGIAVVADRNARELVDQGRLHPLKIRSIRQGNFGKYRICFTAFNRTFASPVIKEAVALLRRAF